MVLSALLYKPWTALDRMIWKTVEREREREGGIERQKVHVLQTRLRLPVAQVY